jgi:hypothetical protein
VKKRRRKQFFFEKKNQKTFAPLRAHVPPSGVTSKNQSFFASFCSQKEVLAFSDVLQTSADAALAKPAILLHITVLLAKERSAMSTCA